MGLLDWIRAAREKAANENRPPLECGFDPREHGHATMREFAAEIRGDEALAKLRRETSIEPEDDPPLARHFTDKGNDIKQLSQSGWHSDDTGLREFRHHVGRSVEGYHGGLEVSNQGGDGPFLWSRANATAKDAEHASWKLRTSFEGRPKAADKSADGNTPKNTDRSAKRSDHYRSR